MTARQKAIVTKNGLKTSRNIFRIEKSTKAYDDKPRKKN